MGLDGCREAPRPLQAFDVHIQRRLAPHTRNRLGLQYFRDLRVQGFVVLEV